MTRTSWISRSFGTGNRAKGSLEGCAPDDHLAPGQMIGETFGSYRVVARIGKGGMGEVYLAEHQRIARTAAIKVIAPELAQKQEVLNRFFVEARATSLIRHPGIVEVFDCDLHPNGSAYIVMEHLEGETLADRLKRERRLAWRPACAIAREVAEAMAAAHQQGIAHRDLKPENVFLLAGPRPAGGGSVKVLDFGVAKLLARQALGPRLTYTGALLGTPAYMSPEQCAGRTDVDHRVDVYALGCMLFEVLTGTLPFGQEHAREVMLGHMFRAPPPLEAQGPDGDIPPWLVALVTRMMAKGPEDRPGSMTEVARALPRDSSDPPPAPQPEAPAPSRQRRSGRPRGIVVWLGSCGLFAAGVLVGAWLPPARHARGNRPPAPWPAAVHPAPSAVHPAPSPVSPVLPAGPAFSTVEPTISTLGREPLTSVVTLAIPETAPAPPVAARSARRSPASPPARQQSALKLAPAVASPWPRGLR